MNTDISQTLDYSSFEAIIEGNRDSLNDTAIDTAIDIEIIGGDKPTSHGDTQNFIPFERGKTYSLDEVAEILKCSTKTIYRSGNGYFQRICECWYWLVEDFKKGNDYTQLALEKMICLQSAISPKNSDGSKNKNKVLYEDFKLEIWQEYQSNKVDCEVVQGSQLAVVTSTESTLATDNLARIYHAQNEASKLSETVNNFSEKFEALGEEIGHSLAANIGGAMIKSFNEDMSKIMEKLGNFS